MMQKTRIVAIFLTVILFSTSCEPTEPSLANLTIADISFDESYRNVVLDLPNGVFMPDNPDFDINIPETWTGNMAQYVNHNYLYLVTYSFKNSGGSIAFDAELDLHYVYDDNSEYVETIYLGNIMPNDAYSNSKGAGCTNKQLVSCWAEVFWFD